MPTTSPSKYDFKIFQGGTFNELITWSTGAPSQPIDLTGCTAKMQVRSSITAPTILLELSSVNGAIVLGGSSGTIQLFLNPEQTASINWTSGVYDLEINFNANDTRKLLFGTVTVVQEVTR